MHRKNRIAGKCGTGAGTENGLHVWVDTRPRNILKPVDPVGHRLKGTARRQLAQLNGRNTDPRSVCSGDVAVLVERDFA
jgi:hypothetical protein